MKRAVLFAAVLLPACASSIERDLARVNAAAIPGPGNCQDHVLRVAGALRGRFEVRGAYTVSSWYIRRGHVSALVVTPEGAYVLDNGALGIGKVVLTQSEFEQYAPEKRWIGELPKAGAP